MCIYTIGQWTSLGIGAGLVAMILWAVFRLFCPCRRER